MLHWIMDPEVSGFIIGYDLDDNQVLICNFDVRTRSDAPDKILNNPPVTRPKALDKPALEPAISGRSLTAFVIEVGTINP